MKPFKPLDGDQRLPEPFDARDLVPDEVDDPEFGVLHPERFDPCPSCDKQAYGDDSLDGPFVSDGMKWCRICGFDPVPRPEIDPEEIKAEIEKSQARLKRNEGRCEEFRCLNYAVVQVTYPIHSAFDGKHLGDETIELCVGCYRNRHDEDGIDPIRGMRPSSLEYVTKEW